MVVVDASAILELLLRGPRQAAVEERLYRRPVPLAAPSLLDLEVLQVLRRLERSGQTSPSRCAEAVEDLRALGLARYAPEPFLERLWELRENFTAYDACYLALAETSEAALVTCDRKLADPIGSSARVECIV